MSVAGSRVPLVGTAAYEEDPDLAAVLRIQPDDFHEGMPEIIIRERTWKGRVIPDLHHGCDYCFIPAK